MTPGPDPDADVGDDDHTPGPDDPTTTDGGDGGADQPASTDGGDVTISDAERICWMQEGDGKIVIYDDFDSLAWIESDVSIAQPDWR